MPEFNVLKISGHSDDIVQVEGCGFTEEFYAYDKDEGVLLAVSDGTLLRVMYDKDGCWRITKVSAGASGFSKMEGDPDGDYTDRVELRLSAPLSFKWVLCGEKLAMPGRRVLEEQDGK